MATGTVKWFSDEKGFGFITPDEPGKGPLRPSLGDQRRRLPLPHRGREGHVRGRGRRQGPEGGQRLGHLDPSRFTQTGRPAIVRAVRSSQPRTLPQSVQRPPTGAAPARAVARGHRAAADRAAGGAVGGRSSQTPETSASSVDPAAHVRTIGALDGDGLRGVAPHRAQPVAPRPRGPSPRPRRGAPRGTSRSLLGALCATAALIGRSGRGRPPGRGPSRPLVRMGLHRLRSRAAAHVVLLAEEALDGRLLPHERDDDVAVLALSCGRTTRSRPRASRRRSSTRRGTRRMYSPSSPPAACGTSMYSSMFSSARIGWPAATVADEREPPPRAPSAHRRRPSRPPGRAAPARAAWTGRAAAGRGARGFARCAVHRRRRREATALPMSRTVGG